jgi:tetratricopeptide (TPR) repeat protein
VVKTNGKRACPVCGTLLPHNSKSCPVCVLQGALGNNQSASESPTELTRSPSQLRLEHYKILTCEDGTPVELGRGAMGVTYKALDVNLRCTVALKVISAQFLGDEVARRRFVREARAAASVRHPNVASVFHLGKSGDSYFYAMEFVDGEPLDRLIRRSNKLEVKLALEIATQVAAGLAGIHERNLVHRDIKPSNIMVKLKGDSSMAKVIDLGLAKGVAESQPETAVSIPGSFAGTPAFASPEQFAGVDVDIRSDLYSLGIALWNMLTGRTPFRGTSAEVMYQHQHTPLPIDQLERVPQPVVVLLKVLLEKDPAQRFQTPAELLKAMPAITEAIDTRRSITPQSFQKTRSADSRAVIRRRPARLRPKKISVARLPVTGRDVFGREEDIAFLDAAWAGPQVNLVTIVAWAGVGKSTLINHWLRKMAADHYRSAELVFGWSFYRQGTSTETSSADEFLDAALNWFGDPDPRIGTAWEKGERLAKLVAHRRTLLLLDGLEPLQNRPGPQEGRVREPSLQALLRELAAFNTGLCVITTRLPVADIADHEGSSALRRDLDQLSSDAGAKLLRALGVKGHEPELRSASDEFSGHCLALTLLGSYLTDAYNGDIRCRKEVSEHLGHDVRHGVHARKVMESYQTWFGEGPELSLLRILGLFDRPADEKAIRALLKPPAILGLTETLADLSPTEWRTIVARLRRAKLLAGEDPHNPGQLDTHPLVREYFGDQLRSQGADAWKECNRRLYSYYQTLAPQLPNSFREMEPLFLSVICGCNAGLFREALHEVYIPRIQRGDVWFAESVLRAKGALLSVLFHFFERGRWGSLVENGVEGQCLTAEDQLFVLIQAGYYLMSTRGYAVPEARIFYERAESLCHSLNRPLVLFFILRGLWFSYLVTEKLTVTMQIAKRVYSLAQDQNNSALMVAAYRALACTLYCLGDFETARQYATSGVQIWRSGGVQSPVEDATLWASRLRQPPDGPALVCLCYQALSEWHFGEIVSCHATMAEAVSLAKGLNDIHALAVALWNAGILAHYERNPAEVRRCASDLIEHSTHQTFASWLPGGVVFHGWARSASGSTAEGLSWIEDGIADWRATGSTWSVPYLLTLKAEALHLAGRASESLEAIREAEALVERSEERWCSAELQRLRGVFLAALGADEAQIDASFCEAIRIAKEQKSVSLEKRAEASYAEYRRLEREPKAQ